MNKAFFSCIICYFCFISTVHSSDFFRMNPDGLLKNTISILTVNDTVISLPFNDSKIYGMSIDMDVMRTKPYYFIRVLLEDFMGEKYLVAESYQGLSDCDTLRIKNYCEETISLDGITPRSMYIYVNNAKVKINAVNILVDNRSSIGEDYKVSIRNLQLNEIVNRLNVYNRAHGKLWAAGITSICQKPFSEKMRILEIPESEPTDGMEYYVGGIFEMGEVTPNAVYDNSSYVPTFDWRDRHGKNWITPFRDQGNSCFCSAFAAVGCLEALVNIYNNYNYDLDLSEQEAACCSGAYDPYYSGISIGTILSYMKTNGICDEVAYPFVDDPLEAYCKRDQVTPNTVVRISNYYAFPKTWNNIKNYLIHYGPMPSGYWRKSGGHAMTLIGYKTLQVGDTVRIMESTHNYYTYVITENDERIGMTCWTFKNSYANQVEDFPWRIFNILFYDTSIMVTPFVLEDPIIEQHTTTISQVCEDADGDGYYYWGLGAKPADCPLWVPDSPDGDDSNINYGVMDTYGYLEQLPAGLTIKTEVTYNATQQDYRRFGVVNGGVLRITGHLTMIDSASIRVCEGGTLIVDGGTIQDADIQMIPGSTLIVRNNGKINMAVNKHFNAPFGVFVNIENGEIN